MNIRESGKTALFILLTLPFAAIRGQSSFDWMVHPSYPGELAMAGAGVARQWNPESIAQNPAGMKNRDTRLVLHIGGRRYPAGINQLASTVILPGSERNWGLMIRTMHYGTFDGFDGDGQKTASYNAGEIAVLGGLRQQLGRFISLGGSLGLAGGILADVSATAVIWNYGVQLLLPAVDARLGLAMQNDGRFLTHYSGDTQADRLPTRWVGGLSKSLAHLPLTFHLSVGRVEADKSLLWMIGGEFRLPGNLVLRWGVDQGKPGYQRDNANLDLVSGISLGLGTRGRTGRWSSISIDGAIKLQGPLGMTSALSVGWRR
jgi:hypothetical protein